MRTTFEENEIPYEKFASIGLSQEMVDDLPEMVMKKLLEGHWTPILPISVDFGDGIQRTIQARLKLERRSGTSTNSCVLRKRTSSSLIRSDDETNWICGGIYLYWTFRSSV